MTQEIKTTLVELDADIATAKSIGAWSINKEAVGEKVTAWISTMLGVESKLPAIRAYIDSLEHRIAYLETHRQGIGDGDVARAVRLAEAGRVLAEAVIRLQTPSMDRTNFEWQLARDTALSAYNSATRDITSKEKEV